jgi:uncharacterized protein YjdB
MKIFTTLLLLFILSINCSNSHNDIWSSSRDGLNCVETIFISPSVLNLPLGMNSSLSATTFPNGAVNKDIEWEISDPSIATVDANGNVSSIALGTTSIIARYVIDSSICATSSVTVTPYIPATTLSLNTSLITANNTQLGTTQQLTSAITPSGASNQTVSYSSSNTAVASVSLSGIITINNTGSAKITAACESGTVTAQCVVSVVPVISTTFSGNPFTMTDVPIKTFVNSSATSITPAHYLIAETETTYDLWTEVFLWATANGYSITSSGAGSTQLPVSNIQWTDVIVWCNAFTAYYNSKNGTSLTPAYYLDSAYTSLIINASFNPVSFPVKQNPAATGFRLPSSDEWELAARYIGDFDNDGAITTTGEFTSNSALSGGILSSDTATINLIAWYYNNSSTAMAIKQKKPNPLGLYDIHGNVAEMITAPLSGSTYLTYGGSFSDGATILPVNITRTYTYNSVYNVTGFRLVRTE